MFNAFVINFRKELYRIWFIVLFMSLMLNIHNYKLKNISSKTLEDIIVFKFRTTELYYV